MNAARPDEGETGRGGGVEELMSLELERASLGQLAEAFRRTGLIDRLLAIAVEEDTGLAGLRGDRTAAAMGEDGSRRVQAQVVPRRPGAVAGLAFLDDVLRAYGATVRVQHHTNDGERVAAHAPIASLHGPIGEIVVVERTVLNLLGRMCGVATTTALFMDAMTLEAPGSPTGLYDTRKTTPGLRLLEKYAVRCGGGQSHRLGLHDAVMLKDNHIAGVADDELARFVGRASARARQAGPLRFFEVEVDRLEQLDAVLTLEDGVVDIALLDNMSPDELAEAVRRRDAAGRGLFLESSGGVRMETIGLIARTRIDRVSTGALTHSAVWMDIGLDIG